MNEFKAWLGQVTTGHGAAVVGGTLLAVLSGSMTWQMAAPVILGGVVAILWPENTKLAVATQTVAAQVAQVAPAAIADFHTVQQAYLTGVAHGNAAATSTPAITPVVTTTTS